MGADNSTPDGDGAVVMNEITILRQARGYPTLDAPAPDCLPSALFFRRRRSKHTTNEMRITPPSPLSSPLPPFTLPTFPPLPPPPYQLFSSIRFVSPTLPNPPPLLPSTPLLLTTPTSPLHIPSYSPSPTPTRTFPPAQVANQGSPLRWRKHLTADGC